MKVSAPASIAPSAFCSAPPISITSPSGSSSPVAAMRWPPQEVAAAQAVVDLEREREPGGRPADPLDRVVHLDRDVADADVVGDRRRR